MMLIILTHNLETEGYGDFINIFYKDKGKKRHLNVKKT